MTRFLLAAGLLCACDTSDSGGGTVLADADLRTSGSGMQTLPHEVELIPGTTLQAMVDTRELEPHDGSYTLLLETVGAESSFSVVDENGDTIAESEPYAVVEGTEESGHEGEVHYYAFVELSGDTNANMEVIGEVDEGVIGGDLIFCDQLVTNRQDGPPGSLRYAVDIVRDGGSVCFDPVAFGEQVLTASGEIILGGEIATSKAISIHGLASKLPNPTTYNADRVFRFSGPTVLRNLSLSHGTADRGGLIHASDALDMTRVNLRSGTATGVGGGLYHIGAGSLTVRDSTIRDCQANLAGGVFHEAGPAVFHDTAIFDNSAVVDAGGGIGVWGIGELEQWVPGGPVTLSGTSSLAGNTTGGRGGGIFAETTLTVSGTVSVSDNAAATFGGGIVAQHLSLAGASSVDGNSAQNGGGVWIRPGSGTASFLMQDQALIEGNSATLAPGFALHNGGGGVHFSWNSPGSTTNHTFEMKDGARIANNHTDAAGGGVFIPRGDSLVLRGEARIEFNTAANGGGIFNQWGSVEFREDSVVGGNVAEDRGGGLYVNGHGPVLVSDYAAVEGNDASEGGGIYFRARGYVLQLSGDGTVSGNNPDDVNHP